MKITVVGISHLTAPLEIREKFFLRSIERELLISELKSNPTFVEGFVLSTCNRTEIYVYSLDEHDVSEHILHILFQIKKIDIQLELKECFYVLEEREAVTHMFKVACGLDSLVLGEKQVLGQFKEAIELARNKGMFSSCFNVVSNLAIRSGKKARCETDIDVGGSSISWAAVLMAQNVLQGLEGRSVLALGAGKMGELSIRQLKDKGVENIYVVNRTHSSAVELAQKVGGIAVSFYELKDVLSRVDVCICSASAPLYILDREALERVMAERKEREILLIDISVPRNIDPEAGKVEGVHLYAMDDLQKAVASNLGKRKLAISQVEKIIEEKVDQFYQKLEKLDQDKSSYKSLPVEFN